MVKAMIEIRGAQASDTPGVAELVRQLGYTGDDGQVEQTLRHLRDSPVDVALVAVEENITVGVVAVHAVPRLAEGRPLARITTLVVRDEWRGQGAGRRLLAAAEAEATALGCSVVEVTSHRRYTAAGAGTFYVSEGYSDAAEASTRFIKVLAPLP